MGKKWPGLRRGDTPGQIPGSDDDCPVPGGGRDPFHPLAMAARLRHDTAAVVGALIVVLFVTAGLLAPLLAPFNPGAADNARMNEAPFWLLHTPAPARHWCGLDVSGRDIASRVLYGARTSILVGIAVVTIASLIGVTLGSASGYAGGAVDAAIMRVVDVLLAFPFLILAIAFISVFPRTTVWHVALVLGLTSWPGICRLMRAQVLKTRELDYIAAATALGAGHTRILMRHILPNCIGPVVIWFTIGIAGAVMAESSLSFLGFGDVDSLSWGAMIDNGLKKSDFPREWWPVVFPSAALAMLVLGFNMLGDGLQDALNPRLK